MLANDDQTQSAPPSSEFSDWDQDAFASLAAGEAEEAVEDLQPQVEDIAKMLSALAAVEDIPPANELPTQQSAAAPVASQAAGDAELKLPQIGSLDDPELAEAFSQDAARGVAQLDQAIIDLESGGDVEAALATIGRELHTLKGAASTIGLTDVGRYLHDVEDYVQAAPDATATVFLENLIACVDLVRRQVTKLSGSQPSSDDTDAEAPVLDSGAEGEDTISVKASQLDRLLDMLASLVMLRNRREARVDELRRVHEEVTRCGARLREVERRITAAFGNQVHGIRVSDHSNPLNEVGSDLLEISRNLQGSFEPVAEENLAVSNFIGQFRQALVTLLRMPMSGLFRRLQRAALDAARVEGKRVRLDVQGGDVGLERSVQERLFDPLLHIIRNSVGHGIETPAERLAAGKPEVGTITLTAEGDPNRLTLTIRDDGKGLNYEAICRRGRERGLIATDAQPSRQELAQLIFQRGFSTRETTNEVAGRGIGMDVVAETLDRMQAWIEVESEPGSGTVITLTIPLRSLIDHTMVFRVGGQLFALPMPALLEEEPPETRDACLAGTLGLTPADSTEAAHVLVEANGRKDAAVRFRVDELLGPEEVVVRPLPPLLRSQSLFRGVTLAGTGEVVLVLDPVLLTEGFVEGTRVRVPAKPEDRPRRILIVDDSLSARRAAANMWSACGWEAVEAADGSEGVQRIKSESFDAVLTDFDMPKMNGVEFIQAARDVAPAEQLPIIMLSSRQPEEMEAVALNAGATGYLQKPITEEKLLQIRSQFLPTSEEATHE